MSRQGGRAPSRRRPVGPRPSGGAATRALRTSGGRWSGNDEAICLGRALLVSAAGTFLAVLASWLLLIGVQPGARAFWRTALLILGTWAAMLVPVVLPTGMVTMFLRHLMRRSRVVARVLMGVIVLVGIGVGLLTTLALLTPRDLLDLLRFLWPGLLAMLVLMVALAPWVVRDDDRVADVAD